MRAKDLKFWDHFNFPQCLKCCVWHVMCQVSCVKCHMSNVKSIFCFICQSCWASWWRVCLTRPTPSSLDKSHKKEVNFQIWKKYLDLLLSRWLTIYILLSELNDWHSRSGKFYLNFSKTFLHFSTAENRRKEKKRCSLVVYRPCTGLLHPIAKHTYLPASIFTLS